jgi:penicillin-binding protein 2
LPRNYLKTADHEWYRQRINLAVGIVLAAFLILLLRLFYLQLIEGQEFRRLSENNCIRLQSIDPPRGLIFDRHGRLLVDNRASFDLSINPRDARPLDQTLGRLACFSGLDLSQIQSQITRHRQQAAYRPIPLRRDMNRDALAAIEARRYDLPGVVVEVRARRHYLYGESAGHLLGYLGEVDADELAGGKYPGYRSGDFIGKTGAEKAFETLLRGERGGRQVEVDARGQVVRVLRTVDAVPGRNLRLSIDQRLQAVAESALGTHTGAVVALDPNTGQVLAMVSQPSFDPNLFVGGISRADWQDLISNPKRPMENKAIQAEYPPASLYKVVTALAGLQEGVVDAHTRISCAGQMSFGNRVYRCWKKGGHGQLNILEAISQSCDVFFYQTGIKLGVDRLAWYARACGLGALTGVDLDHEQAGLIPTAAWKQGRFGVPWQRGETLSIAIGQGFNLVTPLQMAVLMAAVGNGGTLYRPQLLYGVDRGQDGPVEPVPAAVTGKIPVGEQVLAMVQEGLFRVVQSERGTARRIRLDDVAISGKTGTAQVFSRKGDADRNAPVADHLKDHAWFGAYAPSQNPQIAVAVVVEHGESGSSAAAPVAKAVIQAYLKPDDPVAPVEMVSVDPAENEE